jgi:hypothetical protein
MKLTKAQIKQIIKEELEAVMKEIEDEDQAGGFEYDEAAAEAELQAKLAEPMHQ